MPKKGSLDSVITHAKTGLRKIKIQFPEKLIHLNINSIRNKSDSLSFVIENIVDILFILETKLDDSFPHVIIKYVDSVCLNDMIKIQWVVDFYIGDDIPTKLLKHNFWINIEKFSVKINLRKRKSLFNGSYNPHKNKILNYLNYLNLACSKYSKVYDKYIFTGDFNVSMSDKAMEDFCSPDNLESLIKKLTYYKIHENPTCVDLILTNRPGCFQHSNVFQTGISDFNLLIVT